MNRWNNFCNEYYSNNGCAIIDYQTTKLFQKSLYLSNFEGCVINWLVAEQRSCFESQDLKGNAITIP